MADVTEVIDPTTELVIQEDVEVLEGAPPTPTTAGPAPMVSQGDPASVLALQSPEPVRALPPPRSAKQEKRRVKMASKTDANDQPTDAVSQVNTQVLGVAPSLAAGQSFLSMAQATGLTFQNAVAAQQQVALTHGTSAVKGTSFILGLAVAAGVHRTARANAQTALDEASALALLRLALGL